MELNCIKILLDSPTEPVDLYTLGDFHIGHKNHDEEKLKAHLKEIENNQYAKVLITGDIADGRNPDHKYFDFEQADSRIDMRSFKRNCYAEAAKLLWDIKEKIIGIHRGNHDMEQYGHPYVEELADKLDTKYLGYRAITKLSINTRKNPNRNNNEVVIFSTHGSGGGRKSGAKVNRIEEEALSIEADMYVQGHTHYLGFSHGIKHILCTTDYNRPRLLEKEQTFINAGSYLKSYNIGNYTYSEKNSYKPQITGCIKTRIEGMRLTPSMLK